MTPVTPRVISVNLKLGGGRKLLGGVNLLETQIYTPRTLKIEKMTISRDGGGGVVSELGESLPP